MAADRPAAMQVPQEGRHRLDRHTVWVKELVGLPLVAGGDQPAGLWHDHGRQVARVRLRVVSVHGGDVYHIHRMAAEQGLRAH